jgi:DNA-binding transcriptional regulator YiaG
MNINQFELELEKLKLSKKEFAALTDLPYQTIMNWKRSDSVPKWVKSWLENYIKAKDLERVADAVAPILKARG